MASEGKTVQSIDDVLKESLKKFDLRVAPLDSIVEDVLAYTTGNIAIDHITGVGGLPVGRSVELFGAPSSGKTTTALQACVQLQRLILSGGNDDPARGPIVARTDRIVYFDYEHATDPRYCEALGLDIHDKSFLFAQPESLEQGANVCKRLIETGELRLFVWDSVAAAAPMAKLDADIEKSLPALAARQYAVFTSTINEPLHRNNCTGLFLNHVMEVMSIGGPQRPGMAPLTTTPGGRALKFYSSVRIEYKQIGSVKEKVIDPLTKEEKEVVKATNVKVKVVKNKVGAPFREAVVRVRYGKGFDNFWTALQILIAHGKVKYSAGFFYFNEVPGLIHEDMERAATGMKRPFVRGEQNIFKFADARPEWREDVIKFASEVVSVDSSVLDVITPTSEEPDTEAVETSDGESLQVNLATGELISEAELEKLTSFIPEPGTLDAPTLKAPLAVKKPTAPAPSTDAAKLTADLLADL